MPFIRNCFFLCIILSLHSIGNIAIESKSDFQTDLYVLRSSEQVQTFFWKMVVCMCVWRHSRIRNFYWRLKQWNKLVLTAVTMIINNRLVILLSIPQILSKLLGAGKNNNNNDVESSRTRLIRRTSSMFAVDICWTRKCRCQHQSETVSTLNGPYTFNNTIIAALYLLRTCKSNTNNHIGK